MIDPNEDLIVMYHYIWPDSKAVPGGIRPMLVSQFEKQLDWLSERYEIVNADEFLMRCSGGAGVAPAFGRWHGRPARGRCEAENTGGTPVPPERPRCLLTFDDATRDHAEIVTPILLRRNLSGVFFAIQNPSEGILPLTHAAHWLLSDDDERVWKFFVDEIPVDQLGDEIEAKRIYHYESAVRARVKYAINFALDEQSVRRVLSKLARGRDIELDQLARDWFASPKQLRSMHDSGLTIGVHARTHRSLKAIGGEEMAREIESCTNWLTNLLSEKPRWFACPFGGVGASDSDVERMQRAIRENGLMAAVSTVSSSVPQNANRFALPRVDCVSI
ncbi:MAG TPA: polysaccharide deacetylase family protein [Tepidisphaeraceae bacterium]|nr:polysaccharide deacetylase family protein [Tepidisphaeraceae bacterium]